MVYAFFILSLFLSEIRHQLGFYDREGRLPYRFGVMFFCILSDISILFNAVIYLGVVGGVIYTLLSFLGGLHCTVGWVIKLPSVLLANTEFKEEKMIRIESSIMVVSMILFFIFGVISLIVTWYKSALPFLKENWLVLLIISGIGFIVHFFLLAFSKRQDYI